MDYRDNRPPTRKGGPYCTPIWGPGSTPIYNVQRYVARSSENKWLLYSDRLCDKRELDHYSKPRILVQQIFWQRMSAFMQEPTEPYLYLNTLFAVYDPTIPLASILAILNSRFVSASYERHANRLFGDKFPKVNKADLAAVPVPRLTRILKASLSQNATSLQRLWGELRDGLRDADRLLKLADAQMAVDAFPDFWLSSEDDLVAAAAHRIGRLSPPQADLVRQAYRVGKTAVDAKWHEIEALETATEALICQAYRVPAAIYQQLLETVPVPQPSWALR